MEKFSDRYSKFNVHFGTKYIVVEPSHNIDGTICSNQNVISLYIDRTNYELSQRGMKININLRIFNILYLDFYDETKQYLFVYPTTMYLLDAVVYSKQYFERFYSI